MSNYQTVFAVDVFEEREDFTRRLFTKFFNYDEEAKAEEYVDWYNGIFAPKRLPNSYAELPYKV